MKRSLRAKLFFKFVDRSMKKKYVNNEQTYITKRCPGQTFEAGGTRETKYKPSKGYKLLTGQVAGVNYELLSPKKNAEKATRNRRVIYMLHGGAYHLSMNDMYNGVMEQYSRGSLDVFAIDYRTAPKDPYPAALRDAEAGYAILLSMGYKPDSIIIAGDSAGGGLALALALKLNADKRPLPDKFVLSSPWVDLSEHYTPEQKATDVLFGWGNVLEMCADAYADGHDLKDPYISPLYGDFSFLKDKRVYISIAKGEMLENAAAKLADKMKAAGVNVMYDNLDTGMHAIITMYMLSLPETKLAWERVKGFAW